jgi:hypothetical protein
LSVAGFGVDSVWMNMLIPLISHYDMRAGRRQVKVWNDSNLMACRYVL